GFCNHSVQCFPCISRLKSIADHENHPQFLPEEPNLLHGELKQTSTPNISSPSIPQPNFRCQLIVRGRSKATVTCDGSGATSTEAIAQALERVCRQKFHIASLGSIGALKRSEAESTLLDHFNRVASAAAVVATNSQSEDSALQLFDTSAWLYDSDGRRRDSYTKTDSWLAWYPGLNNETATIGEILATLPKVPETAIPWLIRFFENPDSWFRFRGAIHLADHDVLHVLLGRGLQDQDEAFVLGFAMGTAKKVSRFQYYVFKWVMVHLYPEPYRIPSFLLPAFDIGMRCGIQTGRKNLYQEPLKELKNLTVKEARNHCGIDSIILRQGFREEQDRIPFTIASLRLPTT
ncbi:MAG: hypothetical protein SGI77_27255, partial [Pirellulaceae bacterium]|nr:hypothetical protein [Pirellulaceae bacterium]